MINKNGTTGTLLFHLILFIIVLILGFSTPFPLPSEEGIIIDFGLSDFGSGNIEPASLKEEKLQPPEPIQKEEQTTSSNEDGYITQDFEEAPAIQKKEKKSEKLLKKDRNTTKEEKETLPEKKEEKPRTVNQLALYKNTKTNQKTSSEGETYIKKNNQGVESGDPDSKNYFPGVSGEGMEFNLDGRKGYFLPEPDYSYQEEGKVVVEIIVNREGIVTNATPGIKGSTTLEKYFLDAAKKAALKSSFDKNPNAPAFQKGTITYYFKLKD